MLPTGPICFRCRSDIAHNPAPCPECSEPRPLAYPSRNTAGVQVCASCAGEESAFACVRCGREDHPYSTLRVCTRCVLAEHLTEVLTDPRNGNFHRTLRPLYDELILTPRPLSVIGWLTRRPATGAAILRRMAAGEIPITHNAFKALPTDRRHNHLRQLMVSAGILTPYHAQIEQIERWIDDILRPLDADSAAIVNRYARWRHLRHLRTVAERGGLNKGTVYAARSRVNAAIRLSTWANARGLALPTIDQADLESYMIEHPTGHHDHRDFITWLCRAGINTSISIPRREKTNPEVVVSDTERWRQVNVLLHDHTIQLYARVGGLFTLLFAQPLESVVAMRADQITLDGERMLVTFNTIPIEMPPGLDELLRRYLENPGTTSISRSRHGWLFPGRPSSRHMLADNIRRKLVARDIRPRQSRSAAMFALAGGIPAPVLAELVGINDRTATLWTTLAARDWSEYVTQRSTPP